MSDVDSYSECEECDWYEAVLSRCPYCGLLLCSLCLKEHEEEGCAE